MNILVLSEIAQSVSLLFARVAVLVAAGEHEAARELYAAAYERAGVDLPKQPAPAAEPVAAPAASAPVPPPPAAPVEAPEPPVSRAVRRAPKAPLAAPAAPPAPAAALPKPRVVPPPAAPAPVVRKPVAPPDAPPVAPPITHQPALEKPRIETQDFGGFDDPPEGEVQLPEDGELVDLSAFDDPEASAFDPEINPNLDDEEPFDPKEGDSWRGQIFRSGQWVSPDADPNPVDFEVHPDGYWLDPKTSNWEELEPRHMPTRTKGHRIGERSGSCVWEVHRGMGRWLLTGNAIIQARDFNNHGEE